MTSQDLGETISNIDTRKNVIYMASCQQSGFGFVRNVHFWYMAFWTIVIHFGANSQVESQRACAITKASYGWCGRQILRGKAIHADDGAYKAAIILQQH